MLGVGIVGLLRRRGINATLMTPIATGGSVESAVDLLRQIDIEQPRRLLSPISFETLASPYVASQVEHQTIQLDRIWGAYRELQSEGKFVVVEGGGLMVPITRHYMVLDLLKDFNLPPIIVGKTARGTLNHCMLTLRMMLVMGIQPAGFILNGFGQFGEGFAESLNPDVLEELAHPHRVLATLEWRPEYPENIQAFIRALNQQTQLVSLLDELTESEGPVLE